MNPQHPITFRCDYCPAQLEATRGQIGELVFCPGCGMETTVREPAVKLPPPPVLPPEPPPEPQGPRCAMCGGLITYRGHKFTTQGIIVLMFGLALTPIFIGIVMLMIAAGMREARYACSACGKTA